MLLLFETIVSVISFHLCPHSCSYSLCPKVNLSLSVLHDASIPRINTIKREQWV